MRIKYCQLERPTVSFSHLLVGEVFRVFPSGSVYMKTDKIVNTTGMAFNCLDLVTGHLKHTSQESMCEQLAAELCVDRAR